MAVPSGCKPSPKVTSFVAHVLDALPDVRDIESSLKAIFIVRGDRTSFRKVRVPGYDIILEPHSKTTPELESLT